MGRGGVNHALLVGTALVVLAGAHAVRAQDASTDRAAQEREDRSSENRRIDRLDKSLREVRSIVFQGRDTGQPVIVKPDGPDPQVAALQSRLDDMDQTVRRLSGQLEVLTHDLDDAKKNAQTSRDNEAELRGELKAITDRLAAPDPNAGQAASAGPQASISPPPRPSRAVADDGGTAAAAPAPDEEGASFRAARALLTSGDYQGAGDALQAHIARYPDGPHAREARYWLGESLYIRSAYPEAARAYAEALKGWPKSGWAPEATVKLAQSLQQSGRTAQACQVTDAFATRYAVRATAGLKARAAGVRTTAHCSG